MACDLHLLKMFQPIMKKAKMNRSVVASNISKINPREPVEGK